MKTFVHEQIVRFEEGDPGGIAFFANAYLYAHRAYEAFIRDLGFPEFFTGKDVLVPFVHTECDHLSPMRPGDVLTVEVVVEKLGSTSMTLAYTVKVGERVSARVRMVSVFVDGTTFEKIEIPSVYRQALQG